MEEIMLEPSAADLKLLIASCRIRNHSAMSVILHMNEWCPWIFKPYARWKYLQHHKGRKVKRGNPWKRQLSRN